MLKLQVALAFPFVLLLGLGLGLGAAGCHSSSSSDSGASNCTMTPSGTLFCPANSPLSSGTSVSSTSPDTVSNAASSNDPRIPALAYAAEPYISYPAPTTDFPLVTFAFFQGLAVQVTPSNVGGAITGCTISPDLPAGLSLSSTDCSISGTPSTLSSQAAYVVTATSQYGASQTYINLSVQTPFKFINIPKFDFVFQKGQSATVTTTLGASGSACQTYNGVPTGMTLNSSTCSFSGKPTNANSGEGWWQASGAIGTDILVNWVVPPTYSGLPLGQTSPLGSMMVVDTSLQPLVLYDGQSFGRKVLTVGQAMMPIIPTNTGAGITSCAVTPALPAGLTLSQSDCSISGTPTAPSVPTNYLITPKTGSNSGNTLSLGLGVLPAQPATLACQSDTFCVHPLMPVWSQADPNLANYIHSQGYNVTSDPGWCGGVSGAMLLSTYFQEIAKYSNFQSTAYPSPFTAADTEYPFILKSMGVVGTNIVSGGTGIPSTGLNTFLGQCGVDIDIAYSGNQNAVTVYSDPAKYKYGMPLGWISILNPVPTGSGHALALNGVEGKYFKIFDPWGAVYNATIGSTSTAIGGTISFISGNTGNCVSTWGGTVNVFGIQWIHNYISVADAPVPNGACQ